jgi:CRISPR-associated protein Csb1
MSFTYEMVRSAVAEHAAFRRRQRLQPVGGIGDKLFPPTYPGEGRNASARHVFERRRLNDEDVWTVLIDSAQSSANRAEEALLEIARAGGLRLPYLTVDFSGTAVPEVGEISSLQAPHRVFDAILRDSSLGGKPLMQSDLGKRLQTANMANAATVFEVSPTALLFGAWNSTGEGGGLGAKFPRSFVSEIIGVGVPVIEKDGADPISAGRRTGSRMDPLGTLKAVPVWKKKGTNEWANVETKGFGKSKPSEINHGNIAPSVDDLGVTVDYAEHSVVISFAGLRRLKFGSSDKDAAARTALAMLGLVAHLAQAKQGYALRSRCDLVCEGHAQIELVRFDGVAESVDISLDEALKVYEMSLDAALKAGFVLDFTPVRLTPQEKLVYLVQQSRELALAGKGGEESESGENARS